MDSRERIQLVLEALSQIYDEDDSFDFMVSMMVNTDEGVESTVLTSLMPAEQFMHAQDHLLNVYLKNSGVDANKEVERWKQSINKEANTDESESEDKKDS